MTDQTWPPVTIAIPVYNLHDYVADAINSAAIQDYLGRIQIIVLDDGSTDGSLSRAQEISQRHPNVVVHTHANRGRAGTRNRLLELAPTDLIAWLDGDDIASPFWVRQQVEYLLEHPECLAVSAQGYAMTSTEFAIGPMKTPLDSQQIDQHHINGHSNAFFQSCTTVRKSEVLLAGGYDEHFPVAEDYGLWLRLAERGKLANLPDVHLCYRVHSTSANWTANVGQRNQGHVVMNQARVRRGLPPIADPVQAIPHPKKDDWNRRLYWINTAHKSGNPWSALQMLMPALRRHPFSLLFWLAFIAGSVDSVLFLGNRTRRIQPGQPVRIGELPSLSAYRLGRRLVHLRRRFK